MTARLADAERLAASVPYEDRGRVKSDVAATLQAYPTLSPSLQPLSE